MQLKECRPISWAEGIAAVYDSKQPSITLVTPVINGWVLAFGQWALGEGETGESVGPLQNLTVRLSDQFGEVQAFASHRVIEYHHWMLARSGKLVRSYAYIGESGELLSDVGQPTPTENDFTIEYEEEEFFCPSEEEVMTVAAGWSISPLTLDFSAIGEPTLATKS